MRVFITGAASGIGGGLARYHAARGDEVVLFDRDPRLAAQWAGDTRVTCHVGDVLDRAALDAALGPVDRVYANAGVLSMGLVDAIGLDELRRVFDVNVLGALNTAQAALPYLRETRGTLAVVGSASGHVAYGGLAIYTASKHAVRSLVRQLQHEEQRVRVIHVAPGAVDTNIWAKYRPAQAMTPDQAAQIIARAVDRGRLDIVFPLRSQLEVFVGRHFPRLHARWVRDKVAV